MTERLGPDTTLILFTRIPVPGRAKTRLQGVLPPERCAELQWAMVLDLVERLSPVVSRLRVSYGDDTADLPGGAAVRQRFFSEVAAACDPACSLDFSPQEGADLGARMAHAMDRVFDEGARSCLLMGSDLPGVGAQEVRHVAALLDKDGAVLCPTEDGGYWLVGLHGPCPELFSGKTYGGADVFADAVAAVAAAGLTCAVGPATRDIDTPRDLDELYLTLRRDALASHSLLTLVQGWAGEGGVEGFTRVHPVRGPDIP